MRLFVGPLRRLAPVFYCLATIVIGTLAAQAQTLTEVNKSNGFHDTLAAVRPNFANSINSIPLPLSKKFKEAWSDALESSFDADKMEAAIEAKMAGKLTGAELSELASFYASPLGKHVTALEVQATGPQAKENKKAEGPRILAELQAKDPERLQLYKKIMEDLSAIDMGEAMALNVGYAMVTGMFAAAGQPSNDEQIMALVRQQSTKLREKIEKGVMEGNAYTYRDLSTDDLRQYSAFLVSPTGSHYYDQMLTALGAVLGDEARAFGLQLFVNLGLRKA